MQQINDFLGGKIPLGRVFWLYGVLTSFCFFLFMEASRGSHLYSLTAVMWLIYLLCWYVAMWRSSTNYEGLLIWKIGARLIVLFPIIGVCLALALPLLNHQQPSSYASTFDPSTTKPLEGEGSTANPLKAPRTFSFEEAKTPWPSSTKTESLDAPQTFSFEEAKTPRPASN